MINITYAAETTFTYQEFVEWFSNSSIGLQILAIIIGILVITLTLYITYYILKAVGYMLFYLFKGIAYLIYYILKLYVYIIYWSFKLTFLLFKWLFYDLPKRAILRPENIQQQEEVTPYITKKQPTHAPAFCPFCGYTFTSEMKDIATTRNHVFCEYCGNGLKIRVSQNTHMPNSPQA